MHYELNFLLKHISLKPHDIFASINPYLIKEPTFFELGTLTQSKCCQIRKNVEMDGQLSQQILTSCH